MEYLGLSCVELRRKGRSVELLFLESLCLMPLMSGIEQEMVIWVRREHGRHARKNISIAPSNSSAFTVSFVLNVDIKILLLGPNVEVGNQSD